MIEVLQRSIKAKLDSLTECLGCFFKPLPFALCRLRDLDYKCFCVVHKTIIPYWGGYVNPAFLSPLKEGASSEGIL